MVGRSWGQPLTILAKIARLRRDRHSVGRKLSREEFQFLFDSALNGVMVVDNNGRIVLQNAPMEKQFGYLREELIGQPVEILVPERLRSAHLDLRRAFFLDPQVRPMGAGRDFYGR